MLSERALGNSEQSSFRCDVYLRSGCHYASAMRNAHICMKISRASLTGDSSIRVNAYRKRVRITIGSHSCERAGCSRACALALARVTRTIIRTSADSALAFNCRYAFRRRAPSFPPPPTLLVDARSGLVEQMGERDATSGREAARVHLMQHANCQHLLVINSEMQFSHLHVGYR
jgi:hypothetical protein